MSCCKHTGKRWNQMERQMNKQEIIEWAQCYTVGHAKELLDVVHKRILELYENPSDHIMHVTMEMYRRVARDYLFEQLFVKCSRYLGRLQDMEVREWLEQVDYPAKLEESENNKNENL